MLSSNIFSTCLQNMTDSGPLTAEIGSGVWGTPANFNGFRVFGFLTAATSLTGGQPNFARCSAVSWDGTYIFARCKVDVTWKFCVLLHWQRYSSVLQQRASAKLCGMVQGMELRNFRSGRYQYSAGRPSRWTSAHILVFFCFWPDCKPDGPLFSAEFVCLSLTGTSTLQR